MKFQLLNMLLLPVLLLLLQPAAAGGSEPARVVDRAAAYDKNASEVQLLDDDDGIAWNDAWDEDYDWEVLKMLLLLYNKCNYNSCLRQPLNAIQLRFCGAAAKLNNANYTFSDLFECGLQADDATCNATITTAGNACGWARGFDSALNDGGPEVVTASCVPDPLTDTLSEIGTVVYGQSLNLTVASGEAQFPLPTEIDLWTCVQHSKRTEGECAAERDSTGHPCAMCDNVPGVMYPFDNPPLMLVQEDRVDDDDALPPQQWCLPTHNFPVLCLMLRGKSLDCDGVDDRVSTTTTPTPPRRPRGDRAATTAFGVPVAAVAAATLIAVLVVTG